MNWPEATKIIVTALLALSSGAYATHQHDQAETQQKLDSKILSCSEIIQLVLENRK